MVADLAGVRVQALDRTAPVLPMLPGVPARATHDCKRAGAGGLYAALDLATGTVIGSLHQRRRAIDRNVPADFGVPVAVDTQRGQNTS